MILLKVSSISNPREATKTEHFHPKKVDTFVEVSTVNPTLTFKYIFTLNVAYIDNHS